MNRVGVGDAAYVAAVLTLYADLPDTPLWPSPVDQSVARKLHQEAVPLSLVESALLLATLAIFPDAIPRKTFAVHGDINTGGQHLHE